MLTRYAKTILSFLPLVSLLITQLVQELEKGGADGSLDGVEIVYALVGLVTPALVYLKRNTTTDPVVASNESVALVRSTSRL